MAILSEGSGGTYMVPDVLKITPTKSDKVIVRRKSFLGLMVQPRVLESQL